MMNNAIILAGGIGSRMGNTDLPKQFIDVGSKPIIIHTIEHFQKNELINSIVVVCVHSFIPLMKEMVQKFKLTKVISIVDGGKTNQESIYAGLCEINKHFGSRVSHSLVLIHDAVRPLINKEIISQTIDKARISGACITANPISESVFIGKESRVMQYLDRSLCFFGRAPQTFDFDILFNCHLNAIKEGLISFVDSASLVSYYGYHVDYVVGPAENIKITTKSDLFFLKQFIGNNKND